MRPELEAILADLNALTARGELPDLAAANAFLDQRTDQLNETPDPAMQGLSPRQAYELVHSDWLSDGPLCLDVSLPEAEWADCRVVAGTRGVLRYVADRGPLRLTKVDTVRAADLRKCAAAWRAAVAAFRPEPGLLGDEDGLDEAAVAIEVLSYAALLEPSGATVGVAREANTMLRGSASRFAAVIADARLRLFSAWDESPFDEIAPGLQQPAMVMRALAQSPDEPVRVLDVVARSWMPPLSNDIAWRDADNEVAVAVFSVRYALPLEEYGLIELAGGGPRNWKKWRLRVLPRFRRLVHLAEEPPALQLI
ncbi:MAG: hypothetical protein ACYC3F_12060 [Gemmatimonadaceae bacterium]